MFFGIIVLRLFHAPLLNVRIELIYYIIMALLELFAITIVESPFVAEIPSQIRFVQEVDVLVTLSAVGSNLGYTRDFD